MDEFEEWFDVEFKPYGFMLTPTVYSVENFLPFKGMLFNIPLDRFGPNGIQIHRTTKIRTTFNINDYVDFKDGNNLQEYVYQIKQSIIREFGYSGYPCPWTKSFLPNKTIKKFNFTHYGR